MRSDLKSKWDSIYSGSGDHFGRKPDRVVSKIAELLPLGSTILDYGSGEGRNSLYLSGMGLQVFSFDFSENGVKKTKGADRRIHAFVGDATNLAIKDDLTFDAVICIYVIDYLSDRKESIDREKVEFVLHKIKTHVSPGGYSGIAFAPRYRSVQTGELTDREYHEDSLREAFSDWKEVFWHADWSGVKSFESKGTEHKWTNNNFDVGLIARKSK